MDYVPYRRTNHGITVLHHPYKCRPFFVLKLAFPVKDGLIQTKSLNALNIFPRFKRLCINITVQCVYESFLLY